MGNEKASLLSYKVAFNLFSSICIDKSKNDACSINVFYFSTGTLATV